MLIENNVISLTDQDQTDQIVNDLLVDIAEYERITGLDWRVNGVFTPDSRDYDPRAEQDNGMLNVCARKGIINGLISSQNLLERIVGFEITPRDHVQTLRWEDTIRTNPINRVVRMGRDFFVQNFQLDHKGVEAIAKKRFREYVQTSDVSYYLQEDIVITDEGDYCSATVSRALFPNPKRVLIRDSTGRNYPVDHDTMPIVSGSNWKIALKDNQLNSPCSVSGSWKAQSYDYVFADYIPPEDVDYVGTIAPVYKGTNQEITCQKITNIEGGKRFWFYSWDITDENFQNDTIDLAGPYAEFYKLVDSVDFQCVSNASIVPVASYFERCSNTIKTSTTLVEVELVSGVNGIVSIRLAAGQRYPDAEFVDVVLYYQTSPETAGHLQDLENAKMAIAYFTSAELQLGSCDCQIKTGFIKEAKESYSKVRTTFHGDIIVDLKYGSLYGHLAFYERVKRIKRERALTKI